jgi:ABC-type nitrate/sulfonate/bicarbonate transport system ATPase subunit
VTHDIQEALLLCDKIIVLKSSGQIMGKEVIQSDMPVEERVLNVSNYLEEVYSRHYIPIQKLIMDDGAANSEEESVNLKSKADETVDSIHTR